MLNATIVHLAIVGVGLATAAKLQALMALSMPDTHQIQWVSLNAPELQGLIIDEHFVQARSVQHILAERPVPVLTVARDATRHNTIEHDILYCPFDNQSVLAAWIERRLLGGTNTPPVLHDRIEVIKPSVEEIIAPDLAVFAQLDRPQGMVKMVDAHGEVCLIDTNKQLCWPIRSKTPLMLSHSVRLTYTTHRDLSVQECICPVDLKTWLWQILWQSPHYHRVIAPTQILQLKSWPQPQASIERRDVLRLSAFLQQQPCGVQTLAIRTGLPIDQVQRFASTMYLSGMVSEIPPSDKIRQNVAFSDNLGWKSLFSKLRRQLGL